MANPIRGRSEEIDIYGFDKGYQVKISYDFGDLPATYSTKDSTKTVTWIVRFDVTAADPNNKPKNKDYKIKLLKPETGKKYVIYKADKTIEELAPGDEKDMIAGDPAVGISN
jgi:hypothetical protein